MEYLGTFLAFAFGALSVLAAWRSGILSERCSEHERDLRRQLGRVGALEEGLAALSAQHAKLRGKYYGDLSARHSEPPEIYQPVPAVLTPVCENWVVAQNPQNPGWKGAKECECAYCVTQRAARAATKRAILAERDRAKANGE